MPEEGQANQPTAKVVPGSGSEFVEPEDTKMVVAPEGGWGWMVLLGTMTVNIVLIGHGKSFGVYFKVLMEEFDASPSRVAWLQSLQISTFSFLSPVASVMSQVVGPRKVALVGGVMAFLGLTASAFTPSLEFLYIFYGVVQGIALTLTFTPGITMIAKYFHRRRGLANGMTMAGNALGGIIMPLVAHKLISEYSLRGCFLIMGSILLHSCVGAMLWQPVEWHQKKKNSNKSVPLYEELPQIQLQKSDDSLGVDTTCPQDDRDSSVEDGSDKQHKGSCKFESGLELSIHSSITTIKITPPEFFDVPKPISMYASGPDLHTNSSMLAAVTNSGIFQRGSSSPQLADIGKNHNGRTCGSSVSTESLPVMFKLSPRVCSMKHSSRASSFMYLSSYSFGPTAGAVLTKEHFTDVDKDPMGAIGGKKSSKKLHGFCANLGKFALDTSIFDHSRFYVMTVSLFFHVLGYPGTQIFLPYRATTLGLSQAHAASLLSVMALTDLMGRIGCAWISDFHFCPRKYWFIGGMFTSGIFALSLPFYKTYTTLLLGAAGFGFCCGAYIGLAVVLFADAYSPEKVALAYSISTVSGGFMALGGPPLMGYVLESTGSYLICQSILGSAQFAGAAVWFAEPWAVRWEKRRKERKHNVKSPEEEQLV